MDFMNMMQQMNEQMAQPTAFNTGGKTEYEKDVRFYTISKAKDGSGSVKIRFLPSFNADKNRLNTFITQSVHSYEEERDKKKRFMKEVCPKTVKGKNAECPICSFVWDNYMPLKEAGKKDTHEAKYFLKFAPKDRFISNILIIEDSENPENQGKVFLYEYGKQLHELIQKSTQPDDVAQKEKDLKPFNAWDIVAGKDFRLKLTPGSKTNNGFPSWEESFFVADVSAAALPDQMQALIESTYCLDEFLSEDKIQSDEKLLEKLDWVRWIPKHGQPKEAEKRPSSASKEADLGAIPGMVPGMPSVDTPPFDIDVKKPDDLGELPAWMTGGGNASTPVAPTPPPTPTPIAAKGTESVVSADDFLASLSNMKL